MCCQWPTAVLYERVLPYLLDALTQLLPQCCERLVAVDAVAVLYKLIAACNRSEPHIRIITYALNTLLNVAIVSD